MREQVHETYRRAALDFIESAQDGPFSIEFFAKTYSAVVSRMETLVEEK